VLQVCRLISCGAFELYQSFLEIYAIIGHHLYQNQNNQSLLVLGGTGIFYSRLLQQGDCAIIAIIAMSGKDTFKF